ncbi:MAG: translesion error-prone DNA polymerase V autoproteolytic subunit [Gloeobacteraceae cyanobacterium ES-bin-316]|nr:translesion error-prone DNA polymerase V autoproteolytic subunit [Ferruginibacter sp.]
MKIIPVSEGSEELTILSYNSNIPAGFPSPAADHMEERIDLNKELVPHPNATFVVSCQGDSMINAFIPHKAKLVVDRSVKPQNGSIVVAVLNGEFTVKYLRKNQYKCWLVPANSKYNAIEITEEMNMQVWGVVTNIIINPTDVKCML